MRKLSVGETIIVLCLAAAALATQEFFPESPLAVMGVLLASATIGFTLGRNRR
jgi:hypothetical protein